MNHRKGEQDSDTNGKAHQRTRKLVNAYYNKCLWDGVHKEHYGSDYFNYGYWQADTRNQLQASEQLIKTLLSRTSATSGSILDTACGLGESTRYLQRRFPGWQVVGINVSQKQIEHAAGLAQGSQFAVMDAANLGFRDGSFDHVLCAEAAFHFSTREAFLKESYRILKPTGTLMLSDILFRRHYQARIGCIPLENYVASLNDYEELLRDNGYRDVEVVDATRSCWKAFRRHALFNMTRIALSNRRVQWLYPFYDWIVRASFGTNRYVLAWAGKGC